MRLLPLPISFILIQACDGTAVVDIEDQAPSAPTVSIGPLSPNTSADLVAVIDVDAADPEGAAVTYSYSWKQDGLPRTDLITNTVPSAETTKGEVWELSVTANDGDVDSTAATATTTIVDALPTVTVAITPDAPVAGDDLQAVATAEDADGDAVTLTYAWSLDSAPTDIAADTVPADQTSHGQRWMVTVTASDGEGAGTPGTAEVQIANSAPEVLGVTLVPDAPYVTDDVVAVVEGYDADADAITYTYTFFVDGTEAQSGDSDTLVAGSFAKHQRISVEVVPNDGFDDGAAFVSADAEVQNSLPTATSVAIDPAAAYEASTLTCLPAGFSDVDGDVESWTYAWSVNGTEVGTTATLDGASFNKGDAVTCAATPFDGEASGAAVSNALTISNTAPVLGPVAVSPSTGKVGDLLTCTSSATDADAETPAISYAWSTGETGDTLTLTSAHDPGMEVTCTATATDNDGATSSGSASATVTNTDPVVSTVSVSPSTGKVGDVLTCAAIATDTDGGSPTLSYAWSTGATGATLTLTASNNPGDVLTCSATATDADGGTATGSASATVSNTAPVMGTVSISPSTAYNDDLLTCSASATDADGGTPSLTYAWTNSSTGTALGSGATLSLSSATAASLASIACAVTAADADGGTATGGASVTLGNRAPVVTASLTPSSPTRSSTLTCAGSATDTDDDSTALSFSWTVGGSAVSATSTGTSSSTLSGAFSAGKTVVCTVTASDGKSGSDTDTASVTIGNTAPVVSSVTLSPSTVYTNGTLTANVVSSDADGDTLSLTYAWYVDGALKQSSSSASLSGALYFNKGQAVYVIATANDGTASTSATSSSVTVSNTAPTAPVVEITPVDAVEGDDLTCTVTTAATDADGDAITYSFAWDIDGVDYTDATDSATASVADGVDVGGEETWTCEVVASDAATSGAVGSDSVLTSFPSDCSSFRFSTAGSYFYGAATSAYTMTYSTGNTIEFWLYPDSTGSVGEVVGSRTGDLPSWSIRFSPTGVGFEHGLNNGDYETASGSYTPNAWHHIALVRSSAFTTNWKVFVDGVDVTVRVRSGSADHSNMSFPIGLHVGGQPGYPDLTAAGAIASLQISNTARYTTTFTPSRVLTPDSKTLLYYDFAEGSGTKTYEGTGTGYDLSIASGTWQSSGPGCP